MGEADRDATRKAFSKPAAFVLLTRGLTLTTITKSPAILGRNFCGAVAHATGIGLVRSATVDSEHDGLTVIRMEFIATEEQSRLIGEFLARGPGAPA